jgi:hypothetical protein
MLGLFVGGILGRLPFVLSLKLLLRNLRKSSNDDLRERLKSQYFISHLIIAELLVRGEPLETFRETVRAQLASSSPDERQFGLANANIWFPDLIETEHTES